MNPIDQYITTRDRQIKENMNNRELEIATHHYFEHIVKSNYVKNFTYMGIPILQLPSDLMVMQELIWSVQPDYIIETGVAFGGMTVFYANMLEILNKGMVIGIDVDIKKHNWNRLKSHPLWQSILLIEGSSIFEHTLEMVRREVRGGKVLISLDSNHTHKHVLEELKLYSPLVSLGSYIVVFDTTIEFYHHLDRNKNRPWGKGDNPWTAVQEFMDGNDEFMVDKKVESRAGITAAPGGWLKRVK
jgi:cephalosporin hydroxylase